MKRTLATVLLVTSLAFAATAHAEGVMLAPGDLPEAARATLLKDVTEARRVEPDTFASLAAIRVRIPELDAQRRGRLATVTPALLGLGRRAVPAMLSELAVEGGRGSLTDTAWLAWRLNLLEAVGGLRDPRATSVLEAIVASPEQDFLLVRAAATALGKLNHDAAAMKLIAASRLGAPGRRLAVLAGMGHCRRTPVARRLAEALRAVRGRPGEERAVKHLARALGDVGNAWAWQTPEVQASGDESAVRGVAAEALVEAYRDTENVASRRLLTKAILVVDDPTTRGRIAAAREGANASQRAALDELERRVDRNPLH